MEKDPQTKVDVDALRRENELLVFEVDFLRTRLAGRDDSAHLRQRLHRAERNAAQLRKRLEVGERGSIPPERKAYLEQAERDLLLLLRRISGSPIGRVFRLREGFRELERRYMNGK